MAASRKPGTPIPPQVKQRVAEIYGAGLSYSETAGACGISEKSVERIMQDPEYRKISDDIKRKRTSMSAQVAEVVRDLLEANNTDGTPNMALRQRGAELYAKAPEMLDMTEDEGDETLLPGVILRFPNTSIPDPNAPVEFSEADLAPVAQEA